MIDYDNKDWKKLLFSLKGSIIPTIAPRLLLLALISLSVVLVDRIAVKIEVNSVPWTIVGVALGLLLVFRTNTAYDRYWEGRRMWGGIVNSSYTLMSVVLGYVGMQESKNNILIIQEKISRLICALPILMKQKLHDERDLKEIQSFISNEDMQFIENTHNLPIALHSLLVKEINEGYKQNVIAKEAGNLINGCLNEYINCLGSCERIKNTPLPIAYVLHTKRFLYLFCSTISLPLVSYFGIWSILITVFISYALIGIEEIGVEIEDPFGYDPNDLPLDKICNNIISNIQNLFEIHSHT
jgi:ion channel-forming bestrophin family protein